MGTNYFISKWLEAEGRQAQYQLLKDTLTGLYRNTELIKFLEQLMLKIGSASEQKLLLLWSKAVVLGTNRQPDPDHYEAFREEYQVYFNTIATEQQKVDPIRWLDHQLSCLEHHLDDLLVSKQGLQPATETTIVQPIPSDLYATDQELFTAAELMKILGISKTTLDRRRGDGLREIRNGRKLYFKRTDVIKYLESKRF